jgi:phospholipase C
VASTTTSTSKGERAGTRDTSSRYLISPWARKGVIDHQQLSTDSYLKFIEDDFLHGQRLDPKTDGRPDSRPFVAEDQPGLGNLLSDFNFHQRPRPPLILPLRPPPGPASIPGT